MATTKERRIDALPAVERSIPMKVLCLGHLRTGTISLDAGLKVLGLKSYHGKALMDEAQMKRELPLWIEALKFGLSENKSGKPYGREDFDKIIGGYEALLEPSFLYKDLLQAYPDAKVILTTRSAESWLNSMRKTIFPIAAWDWPSVVRADPDFATPWWEYVKFVLWLICGDMWSENTEITPEAEKEAVKRYEAHNAGVKKLVPQERLLEWHPADGWRPLCSFLDAQVPFVRDFPQVNDADEFVAFHKQWFEVLKQKAEASSKDA